MLKKVFSLFLILAFTSGIFIYAPESASADVITYFGENITYSLGENGVLTLSGEGAITKTNRSDSDMSFYLLKSNTVSIVIENGITEIGPDAFTGFGNVENVTIPASVEKIGSYAFAVCNKLKTVTVSSGLQKIEDHAFFCCKSLESITLPNTLISIAFEAFARCESLKAFTFPDSLKTIEYCALDSCNALESIEVSSNNTEFSSQDGVLFNKDKTSLICYPSSKLSESYVIPDSVKIIEERAFLSCGNLKEITIPDSVTISPGNFGACELLGKITLGKGITGVSRYTFDATAYYQNEQNWEDDALYIEKYLIAVKETCTSYEIKDGTESIGEYAFHDCQTLENVTIPDSVTSIENSSFFGCGSLTTVTIPEGITQIPDNCFSCCYELKSVTLPSGLKRIGKYAFSMCSNLNNINIPNGLESIDERAFAHCASLKSLTIPKSVTSIGNEALIIEDLIIFGYSGSYAQEYAENNDIKFFDLYGPHDDWDLITCEFNDSAGTLTISGIGAVCGFTYHDRDERPWKPYLNKIKSIIINDGIISIDESAFNECQNLISIKLPSGLKSIGKLAFAGCSNLETIAIPNTVTNIGDRAFYCCKNLKNISIPSSVTSIGEYAFEECENLSSIDVEETNSVYSSIDGVLLDKEKTQLIRCPEGKTENSYIIPRSVTSINDFAFYCCDKIKDIQIPGSVTSIGEKAFWNCDNLTDITIPKGVVSIGERAFSECDRLINVSISSDVTSIGYFAFVSCESLTSIIVDSENTVYSSIDGVLFGKNSNHELIKLICYPPAKTQKSYTVPNGITIICKNAFEHCKSIEEITIPDGVIEIKGGAFYGCTNLTKIDIPKSVTTIEGAAFKYCDNLTVYTYEHSYAHQYAEEHKLKCVTIKEDSNVDYHEFGILGDANWDDKVTMEDVVILQKYIAHLIEFTPEQKQVTDVNHDEEVNMIDVTTMQKYIAKLIKDF